MTSTLCQGAALWHIIPLWAAMIAEFFGTIVKIILTIVPSPRQLACTRRILPEGRAAAHGAAAEAVSPDDVEVRSCPRPDTREKLIDFEELEAHHMGKRAADLSSRKGKVEYLSTLHLSGPARCGTENRFIGAYEGGEAGIAAS